MLSVQLTAAINGAEILGRAHITDISTKLEAMQTHRGAIKSSECLLLFMDMTSLVRECDERLMDLENRMRVIEDRLLGDRVISPSGM